MSRPRQVPDRRPLAVALALLTLGAPASAQVVSTFDQARSTSARANAAHRDDAVVGFGTWSSDVRVEFPATTGTATQTSGIQGDSTLANGAAGASAGGVGASGEGSSNFSVHFLVTTPMGFTLVGRVAARALAAADAEGEANAMILFAGAAGLIAATQSDCGANSGQPEPCDKSDDLVASGILAPGIYHLEAHASAAGVGGSGAVTGAGDASFALRISFDGPVVGVRPSTWGDFKSLYR